MLSLLSVVSSDIIGISGVISEIFFVINLLTSKSPLLTGVLSDLISFFNPFSLSDSDNSPAFKKVSIKSSIVKLYLGDGNSDSQGSSIFLEKHNVTKENFVASLGVSTEDFFNGLESYLNMQFSDYVVMLRLNCEGVEDDAIYSAYSSFGSKLKLISGSLKDVAEVKGFEAYESLEKFIADRGITFAQFNSPIYTWLEGQKSIQTLLSKIN